MCWPQPLHVGFLQVEQTQFAPEGHALLQLTERLGVQPRGELGLTCQDDGKQLLFVRFDVGEQANLFQELVRQAVCFIHDEHGGLARAGSRLQ